MAKTYTPAGLAACLLAGNDYTGTRYQDWEATNETQRRALMLNPSQKEIEKVPDSELGRWADPSHLPLNEILRQRGFESRFAPFAPDRFGVLSVLDLRVAWLKDGISQRVTEHCHTKTYPGFRLAGKGCGVSVSDSETKNPIARIETKSGDIVWIQLTEEAPADDIAAAETASALLSAARKIGSFEPADFIGPCISFRESRELNWLAGLQVPGSITLDGGFQETVFGMNREGARAKVATGGRMIMACLSQPRPWFTLNRPAIIAIERPGIKIPLFSAYITPKDWKDPGDLSKL